MRVVFVPSRPLGMAFGGLERQLIETAAAIQELGVDVRRMDPFRRDLLDGVDLVHFFGLDPGHCDMAAYLSAHDVPYVVSPAYLPPTSEIYADRFKSILPGTVRRSLARFLAGASALCPNSVAEARALRRAWGIARTRTVPVTNGVRWPEATTPGRFRDAYLRGRIGTDERFILSVARLVHTKNILELMDATRDIGAFLVLIGPEGATDAGYAAEVRRRAEIRSRDVLHLPGLPPPTVWDAYEDAWVHGLISSVETTGLVSLEAAAQGVNIVVGEGPAVREYFRDIAWFCRARRPESVRAALRQALAAPRNARQQREAVREQHSWRRAAEQTLPIYREICASERRRRADTR